jgi:DNA-directed RNA polymerase subunit H (RpoH/RPB5)
MSEQVNRLFQIKKNQLKLVQRRGYNIDREKNLLAITVQDFEEAYIPFAEKHKKTLRGVLSQTYQKDDGEKTEKLYVYYADIPSETSQLGVDAVGDAIYEMDRIKAKNGILITPRQLSSQAQKKIEGLVSYNIYIFMEDEMYYDPTEHVLTPEHIPLTASEQRDFLKRNNLSIDQLPIILTTDIIVRYYGFKVGQIIQINRTNFYETIVQNSLSYRVVKEDIY